MALFRWVRYCPCPQSDWEICMVPKFCMIQAAIWGLCEKVKWYKLYSGESNIKESFTEDGHKQRRERKFQKMQMPDAKIPINEKLWYLLGNAHNISDWTVGLLVQSECSSWIETISSYNIWTLLSRKQKTYMHFK